MEYSSSRFLVKKHIEHSINSKLRLLQESVIYYNNNNFNNAIFYIYLMGCLSEGDLLGKCPLFSAMSDRSKQRLAVIP